MKDERKLSTSDIATAADREDRPAAKTNRVVRDDEPAAKPAPLPPVRSSAPAQPRAGQPAPRPDANEAPAQLFAADDATGYRTRWSSIQTGFVDEPRRAVADADTLVAEVMKRLAEGFAEERRDLEAQWERADQVSTEDLRLAMRRYRAFFERLLAV
ncbi:MAG: hypothetical protein ACM4AI_06655 [Acidobacteriota bacterium]